MTAVWSDEAKSDYDDNIDYLHKFWTEIEAQAFIDEVDLTLELLKTMPTMFPMSDYKNIRKCVVCKQINLLYQVSEDKIFLVRFWNNYQNPEGLKTLK